MYCQLFICCLIPIYMSQSLFSNHFFSLSHLESSCLFLPLGITINQLPWRLTPLKWWLFHGDGFFKKGGKKLFSHLWEWEVWERQSSTNQTAVICAVLMDYRHNVYYYTTAMKHCKLCREVLWGYTNRLQSCKHSHTYITLLHLYQCRSFWK